MDTPGIPPRTRRTRLSRLHLCAMTLSVVSGTCALVALIGGSPLEFGVALAFCAGWLMAADFIESAVERERERAARTQMHDAPADEAGQRRPLPSAELQRLF